MNKNIAGGHLKLVKGSVKEAMGKLTGDDSMAAEGASEKVIGKSQEKIGKSQDAAGDKARSPQE